MSKMEFLDAFEAKKLIKQKWEQYCGTPCIEIYEETVQCKSKDYFDTLSSDLNT